MCGLGLLADSCLLVYRTQQVAGWAQLQQMTTCGSQAQLTRQLLLQMPLQQQLKQLLHRVEPQRLLQPS